MQNLLYLMTAKICHDLATPLSAMGMGLEALEEDDTTNIIKQSLGASTFKLKFYRDFLNHSTEGPMVSDFIPLFNEHAKKHSIQIYWPPILDIEGNKSRVFMGLVYIMLEPLARGGTLHIHEKEGDFIFVSQGEICRFKDDYREILQTSSYCHARNVIPYFLKEIAKSIHYSICLTNERPLTLEFKAL